MDGNRLCCPVTFYHPLSLNFFAVCFGMLLGRCYYGERRMENGECKWIMENGEWRMENGEWKRKNGEWGIGNERCVK